FFFDEIYLALDADTIKNKLGISIKTGKKDYRFLATDSIKLGKSITINELDVMLGEILSLLEEPGFSINSFQTVNTNDPIIEVLNIKMVEKLINYFNNE